MASVGGLSAARLAARGGCAGEVGAMTLARSRNGEAPSTQKRPNLLKRLVQGWKKTPSSKEVDDLADQLTRTQIARQRLNTFSHSASASDFRRPTSQSAYLRTTPQAGPSRIPSSPSLPLNSYTSQERHDAQPHTHGGDRLPPMPPVARVLPQLQQPQLYARQPIHQQAPFVPEAWGNRVTSEPSRHKAVSKVGPSQRLASDNESRTRASRGKREKRSDGLETDPSRPPGHHQCWGIKRDGTRCLRKIGQASTPTKSGNKQQRVQKAAHAQDSLYDSEASSSSDSDTDREYCHQHAKEINKTPGFVLPTRQDSIARRAMPVGGFLPAKPHANERYIDFEPFMMSITGLQGEESCKARLRAAMSRPPTQSDWQQQGYIYVYELKDRSTDTHIALKVGRTTNVFKRFDEWKTQCYSKRILLRSFFPRDGATQAVLPGASAVNLPGVLLSKKWENLCHIELAVLGRKLNDVCDDCGARHREIFLVPRAAGGYESVCRVISKWLAFVELVAREGKR